MRKFKEKFIEGDWRFMSLVLVCLILGLAFCIERIITLNVATTNTDALLARIDENLKEGNLEGAKEVCKLQVSFMKVLRTLLTALRLLKKQLYLMVVSKWVF